MWFRLSRWEFGLADGEQRRESPDQGSNGNIVLETSAVGPVRHWLFVNHAIPWQPPADMFALPDRLVVLIEIAGMRDADFHVTLQNRRLTVSGVREGGNFASQASTHQAEIHYGEFRTELILPWVAQPDTVSAVYRDGFLRIEMPRLRNRQVHIVDVGLEPNQDSDANT